MKHYRFFLIIVFLLAVLGFTLAGCGGDKAPVVTDEGLEYGYGGTMVRIADNGVITLFRVSGEGARTLLTESVPPEATVDGSVHGWKYDFSRMHRDNRTDEWVVEGKADGIEGVAVEIRLTPAPAHQKGMLFRRVFHNNTNQDIVVEQNHIFVSTVDASRLNPALTPDDWWAFNGGSSEGRDDWLVDVNPGFQRENYQGMNAPDYGGGIPATDIWTDKGGILVASVSPTWRPVSLPLRGLANGVQVGVEETGQVKISPAGSYEETPLYFLIHSGDAYTGLHAYGRVMEAQGLHFPTPPESAYEPMWCAWGYERRFQPQEILATLPKVKELGYKWAGVDDGYQTANGDWDLIPEKFPNGDADMKALVDSIHSAGLKAMLWWVPGDVDPASMLAKNHPDWIVRNADGSPAEISWWDTYYLDPTEAGVLQHQRDLVKKFLGDWGYDGLKTDGQCFNLVPPDYGNHADNPNITSLHSPDILKTVYEGAKEVKPDAILHNCPCGTVFSLYNMPWTDQYVSSDPESSWQIRSKHLVLRAIVGNKISFYGDHVELSTGGDDFASTVGMGGVPGSKFIWPDPKPVSGDFLLTPEREQIQRHWLGIYNEEMLSKSTCRDLYVLGFDKPETHVFEKQNGTMYYSFFADSFEGPVELRGLEKGVTYKITDYDNGVSYGQVEGPKATLDVKFHLHLLLKAVKDQR
ncbi:MAG: glycoside hydrolase family 36 protein [bacterium]